MTSTARHLTFASLDPYALATFWAAALGGRLQDDDEPGDPSVLVTGAALPMLFEQVDDPAAPRRLHLDLQPGSSRAEEVDRLVSLGATLRHERVQPDGAGWVVLADPEGNELCIERSRTERGAAGAVDTGERGMPEVRSADERTMLTAMLDWYRDGVLAKLADLPPSAAGTSPLRSGTTIAGLVKHLAYVEDHWFTHALAQQPLPEPWAGAPFDQDADWEFHSAGAEPLEDTAELYRQACARSREVVAVRSLDDTATNTRGKAFSLRFVLLHLLEETARHLGHLDVLRELADGRTGE